MSSYPQLLNIYPWIYLMCGLHTLNKWVHIVAAMKCCSLWVYHHVLCEWKELCLLAAMTCCSWWWPCSLYISCSFIIFAWCLILFYFQMCRKQLLWSGLLSKIFIRWWAPTLLGPVRTPNFGMYPCQLRNILLLSLVPLVRSNSIPIYYNILAAIFISVPYECAGNILLFSLVLKWALGA